MKTSVVYEESVADLFQFQNSYVAIYTVSFKTTLSTIYLTAHRNFLQCTVSNVAQHNNIKVKNSYPEKTRRYVLCQLFCDNTTDDAFILYNSPTFPLKKTKATKCNGHLPKVGCASDYIRGRCSPRDYKKRGHMRSGQFYLRLAPLVPNQHPRPQLKTIHGSAGYAKDSE